MALFDDMATFSIKTFLSDVPRLLNNNFNIIKDIIKSFCSIDDNQITLTSSSVVATGTVRGSDVIANDIKIKNNNSLRSLKRDLGKVAKAILDLNNGTPLTHEQIQEIEEISEYGNQ